MITGDVESGGGPGRRRDLAGSPGARPLVSVVTVTFNAAGTLRACLESVARQTLPGVEHVVIDGGSTDGTVALLQEWSGRLGSWSSEPDRGIYDAMNKGVAAARGEWILFLGADDVLDGPEALERCRPWLEPGPALVYGDVRYSDGRRVRSRMGPRLLLHNTVHHQGAFYARRVFERWRYDPAFRIVGDYELNLALYLAHERCVRAGVVVSECAEGGTSRRLLRQAFEETNRVRRRHVGPLANLGLAAVYAVEFGLFLLLGGVRAPRAPVTPA